MQGVIDDESLTETESEWFEGFKTLLEEAYEVTKGVQDLKDYPDAAACWERAIDFLEEKYKEEIENNRDIERDNFWVTSTRKQAWYDCIYAKRGLLDIPDWETIIEPRLNRYQKTLEKTEHSESEKELLCEKMRRQLIHAIRFNHEPKHANVLQGLFPDLPFFKENLFKRIVASWSLSAHAFSNFSEEEFLFCWHEFDRLLDDDGMAFIFPLNYQPIDFRVMLKTLDQMTEKTGLTYLFLDYEGCFVDYPELAETLVLKKPNSPEEF